MSILKLRAELNFRTKFLEMAHNKPNVQNKNLGMAQFCFNYTFFLQPVNFGLKLVVFKLCKFLASFVLSCIEKLTETISF